MKIAVTASGEGLDSSVDHSFGRARWFVLIDSAAGHLEDLPNQKNLESGQGAGIQAARQLINKGAEAVITGNVGPNAFRALEAASVKVFQFTKNAGTVREALRLWQQGLLCEVTAPTAKGHGF